MSDRADLLVEIGTEELPPKALLQLMRAFAAGLDAELGNARLSFTNIEPFGTPRRLALCVSGLARQQPKRTVDLKGPPVRIAFDDAGKPTQAADAFARKCGVPVDALERLQTDKGEWLSYTAEEAGKSAAELLISAISNALEGLPIPKPMRWGSADTEFVRPVHWVVLLHGEDVVDGRVLGVPTGRTSRGHRFMADGNIDIRSAAAYPQQLEKEGFVVASFEDRRERIKRAVEDAAAALGGRALAEDALLDEVTALVEWPVAVTGRFDETFLELPREVIASVLTAHQRYFPVADQADRLLPAFVTVANLDSEDPDQVREGNERVVRPRLADAEFFWSTDIRTTLADKLEGLAQVVYRQGLGSLREKAERVRELATRVAAELGADVGSAERAAALAKCDLLTGMVGEFPELQGVMGGYYARVDGEQDAVASAISEHYQPRFAGDNVPSSDEGASVAIADKLDTLSGSFALGKKPSGNRDPFGLRRAALGIVRIIIERSLELDLERLIATAVSLQPVDAAETVANEIYDYIVDRMRAYCLDRPGTAAEAFDAVRARAPSSLADFDARFRAVNDFASHPAAEHLAAANKRIVNILRQSAADSASKPSPQSLAEDAEKALYAALETARSEVLPLLARGAYTDALTRLAELQRPVDTFFDDVMVMADDDVLRRNRLSLLAALREQFLEVADISRLAVK